MTRVAVAQLRQFQALPLQLQPKNPIPPDIMSPSSPPDTEAALTELITTYHELNSSSADIHHGPPTPIQFLRYVHANRPVVFKGAATKDHFEPAKWDTKYLLDKMAGCDVTIAETLLGYEVKLSILFMKNHASDAVFQKCRFCNYQRSRQKDVLCQTS